MVGMNPDVRERERDRGKAEYIIFTVKKSLLSCSFGTNHLPFPYDRKFCCEGRNYLVSLLVLSFLLAHEPRGESSSIGKGAPRAANKPERRGLYGGTNDMPKPEDSEGKLRMGNPAHLFAFWINTHTIENFSSMERRCCGNGGT